MIAAPLYRHTTCPHCTYLGVFEGQDLYHCLQGGSLPTLIARQSSMPPDYISGALLANHVPALGEARKRALSRGLQL